MRTINGGIENSSSSETSTQLGPAGEDVSQSASVEEKGHELPSGSLA